MLSPQRWTCSLHHAHIYKHVVHAYRPLPGPCSLAFSERRAPASPLYPSYCPPPLRRSLALANPSVHCLLNAAAKSIFVLLPDDAEDASIIPEEVEVTFEVRVCWLAATK